MISANKPAEILESFNNGNQALVVRELLELQPMEAVFIMGVIAKMDADAAYRIAEYAWKVDMVSVYCGMDNFEHRASSSVDTISHC